MNKYTVSMLLAMLVVLASVSLRSTFASVGDSQWTSTATAIGTAPVPIPPDKVASIGTAPVPIPPDKVASIGTAPVPIPPDKVASIGTAPVPIPPDKVLNNYQG